MRKRNGRKAQCLLFILQFFFRALDLEYTCV
jgi:hypothetical protein